NTDSSISPVLYDVESGRARELQLPAGVAFGAQFFDGDRKLLLQYTTDTNRASLVAYDLERDTFESVLEPEYGMIDRSVFVKTEHVWYPSSDGTRVPALLYRPKEGAPAANRPASGDVHRGCRA